MRAETDPSSCNREPMKANVFASKSNQYGSSTSHPNHDTNSPDSKIIVNHLKSLARSEDIIIDFKILAYDIHLIEGVVATYARDKDLARLYNLMRHLQYNFMVQTITEKLGISADLLSQFDNVGLIKFLYERHNRNRSITDADYEELHKYYTRMLPILLKISYNNGFAEEEYERDFPQIEGFFTGIFAVFRKWTDDCGKHINNYAWEGSQ
jgi:hypothetical protein